MEKRCLTGKWLIRLCIDLSETATWLTFCSFNKLASSKADVLWGVDFGLALFFA
jgi:hypothetical protein